MVAALERNQFPYLQAGSLEKIYASPMRRQRQHCWERCYDRSLRTANAVLARKSANSDERATAAQ